MQSYKIVLGYVPVQRDMFPGKPAQMMNEKILSKVNEICGRLGDVELVKIDDVALGAL